MDGELDELNIQRVKILALQAEATANLTQAIRDLRRIIEQLKGDLP